MGQDTKRSLLLRLCHDFGSQPADEIDAGKNQILDERRSHLAVSQISCGVLKLSEHVSCAGVPLGFVPHEEELMIHERCEK